MISTTAKAVADGPVGPVLAGQTFTHGKNKVLLHKASNKQKL